MTTDLKADRGMSVSICKAQHIVIRYQRIKLIHCWTATVLKKSVIFVRTKTVNNVRAQVVMHDDICGSYYIQCLSTVSEIIRVIPSFMEFSKPDVS